MSGPRKAQVAGWVVAGLLGGAFAVAAQGPGRAPSAVITSKHNLAASGPGPVTSLQSQVCIFCHTPHSSDTNVHPLWNHELPTRSYNTYTSSTYDAGPATPLASSSKQCLSCHDGTVALGSTLARGLIPTTGSMGANARLTTDLSNDHPLAVQPVDDGQLAPTLFQVPPTSTDPAVRLPGGRVECRSCHDPHAPMVDPVARKFLVRSNLNGALCLACHDPSRAAPNALQGWPAGAHASSSQAVPAAPPFGPYGSVAANACGSCHLPHNSPPVAAERLFRATEEAACSPCHSGASVTPPLLNVLQQFSKTYAHPTLTVGGQHDTAEDAFPLDGARHAECVDCHQPHRAQVTVTPAIPPGIHPALLGASGYDGGAALRPASNEFEVCFKCHSDSVNKPQGPAFSQFGRTPDRLTERTVPDPHNLRLKLGSGVARHNVTAARQRTAAQVPSLRANLLNLNGTAGRSLAAGTYIYCTDCHSNDQARKSGGTGPNGPHGSSRIHLLERRYDLEPPPVTPGSNSGGVPYISGINGTAGICNKCHDVDNSTLRDDSFKEHDKHVRGQDASCSTCHDPHGVQGGTTLNNHSLVNFDLTIVGPSSSGQLRFERTGNFSGRCFLRCHGQDHNPESY